MYRTRQTRPPDAPREAFPPLATVATVALALGAGLAVWLAALGASLFSRALQALENPAGLPYSLVATAAYLAMGAVLVARWPVISGRDLSALGLRWPRAKDVTAIAGSVLIVAALRLLTFGYLVSIGQPGHIQNGLGRFHSAGPFASAVVVLVGATVAPACEELLFRGTIYRAFETHMPAGRAAILSGLVFAAARFDVVLAPFFALYGILLALAYRVTGNLAVPILVRALFDGASYALLVWLSAAPTSLL